MDHYGQAHNCTQNHTVEAWYCFCFFFSVLHQDPGGTSQSWRNAVALEEHRNPGGLLWYWRNIMVLQEHCSISLCNVPMVGTKINT